MSKTINMSVRPKQNDNRDTWVETRTNLPPPPPKPKRLTIDIDPTLHSRLKIHCVKQDTPIADFIRELIDDSLQQTQADDADKASSV